MAAQTLVKTWQASINNHITEVDDLTTRAELLFQIKEILTDGGTFTVPAVVDSSCDSAVAGTAGDGVDRWVDNGDLVWSAAGDRSWCVLRFPNYFDTDEHLYLLLECDSSNVASHRNGAIGVYASTTAFISGSTSARPTSAQEFEILPTNGTTTTANWQGWSSAGDTSKRLHVLGSNDGKEWRIAIAGNGYVQATWSIGTPSLPPATGWSHPLWIHIFGGVSQTASQTTISLLAASTDRAVCWDSTVGRFVCGFGGMSGRSNETGYTNASLVNTFDSSRGHSPIALYSDTAPAVGWMGGCSDMFWTREADAPGDLYPAAPGTWHIVSLGGLAFPWPNNTTPLLS